MPLKKRLQGLFSRKRILGEFWWAATFGREQTLTQLKFKNSSLSRDFLLIILPGKYS